MHLPHQSIAIHAFAFVHPQVYKLFRRLELVRLSNKQSLEHIAEVPDVEFVVEICCSFPEACRNLRKNKIERQQRDWIHMLTCRLSNIMKCFSQKPFLTLWIRGYVDM